MLVGVLFGCCFSSPIWCIVRSGGVHPLDIAPLQPGRMISFLFTRGATNRGEEEERREEEKITKQGDRRLQLACSDTPRTGKPHRNFQRQPAQESQPAEAPDSGTKKRRKQTNGPRKNRKEKGQTKRTPELPHTLP